MAKTTTTNTTKPSLLEALAQAAKHDLEEVRAKIAALRDELAGLKEVEKLLAAKFGETPLAKAHQAKRAKKAARDAGAETPASDEGTGTSLPERIFDLITKHGPLESGALSAYLDMGAAAIGRSAQASGWFEQDAEKKWHIKKF